MNKLAIKLLLFIGLFIFLMIETNTIIAENESELIPIGSFSNYSGDGEHAYGHRARLWKTGNILIGQFTYWYADIEGQRGEFTDGEIESKTGKIRFRVTVKRHNVHPNEYSTAIFEGSLKKGKIIGILTWQGKDAKFRGEKGLEQLNLSLDSNIKL